VQHLGGVEVEVGDIAREPAGKVEVRLPAKGNSNSHGARPVHLFITMIKRIRTSRFSIKNSPSAGNPLSNHTAGYAGIFYLPLLLYYSQA